MVLRPRGYSSRQTNTPAALPLQSRSRRPGREGGWLSGAEGSRSIQPLGWGAPTPPTPARQAPGAGRGSAASLLGAPPASPTRLRSRHRASGGQQPLPSPPPPGRSSGRIHGVGAQVPLRELAGRGHDAPCHEDCEQKRSISGCPAAAWPPPEGTAAGVGAGSLAAPSGGREPRTAAGTRGRLSCDLVALRLRFVRFQLHCWLWIMYLPRDSPRWGFVVAVAVVLGRVYLSQPFTWLCAGLCCGLRDRGFSPQ